MLTIFYENGAKQVIKLDKSFFDVKTKGESSIHKKAMNIMYDLGGIKFDLQSKK